MKDVLYVSDVVSLQLGQTGLLFFSPSYRCIDQQTTPTLLIFSLSRGKNDCEIFAINLITKIAIVECILHYSYDWYLQKQINELMIKIIDYY